MKFFLSQWNIISKPADTEALFELILLKSNANTAAILKWHLSCVNIGWDGGEGGRLLL